MQSQQQLKSTPFKLIIHIRPFPENKSQWTPHVAIYWITFMRPSRSTSLSIHEWLIVHTLLFYRQRLFPKDLRTLISLSDAGPPYLDTSDPEEYTAIGFRRETVDFEFRISRGIIRFVISPRTSFRCFWGEMQIFEWLQQRALGRRAVSIRNSSRGGNCNRVNTFCKY